MSFLRDLNLRLARNDFLQFSIIFFALLLATLAFTWPATKELANNSYFSVLQVRLMSLLLLALGMGALELESSRRQKLITLLAILTLSISSIVFEVATYAVSFPSVPLYWGILLAIIDPIAYYGFGLILAKILKILRMSALLPLAIPAVPIGLIFIDIPLGRPIFNPLTVASVINLPHLFLMTVFATLCLVYLLNVRKTFSYDSSQ